MENFTPDSEYVEFYNDKLDVIRVKVKEVDALKKEMYEKEKEFKLSLLCLFILNIINLLFCIFR